MTEQEALRVALENVEAAMSVLDFPQGSYAADDAYDLLSGALSVLNAGLTHCETEDEDLERSGAVDDAGDPQGEGEGSPDPQGDDGNDDWSGTWSKARYVDAPHKW